MASAVAPAPSGLWAAYVRSLQTSPLWTKALTSFVLNGLEEYIAQQVSARAPPKPRPAPSASSASSSSSSSSSSTAASSTSKSSSFTIKKGVDYERVVLMALYGLLISGPLGHFLYRFVDRVFSGRTGAAAAIGQLLAVNLFAIPIQNYGTGENAERTRLRARATQGRDGAEAHGQDKDGTDGGTRRQHMDSTRTTHGRGGAEAHE